ncbi:MAG: transketolase 2 [Gammaproteobacteria bacterium]|nr:MAG: transketolase 2 [Gammaproteobacteria bacterium]
MSNLPLVSNAIRFLSVDAVQLANSGHPGMPMGMSDIAVVLWKNHLKHNPQNPKWFNRDRFVLSNGHGSMLLYSLLHLSGYPISIDDIKGFRNLDLKLPDIQSMTLRLVLKQLRVLLVRGFQMVLAWLWLRSIWLQNLIKKILKVIDHYTYVFLGDGCLMEGISHEACSFAGTHNLGKLICLYDDNGISIDGEVSSWFSDDTQKRFESYNWQVIKVDGHNLKEIDQAISTAKENADQPTLICCKTKIGFGSPNKEGTSGVHGAALGDDEVKLTRENLGWEYPPFTIPREVYEVFDAKATGEAYEDDWNNLLNNYQVDYPEDHSELLRTSSNNLPDNFEDKFNEFLSNCVEESSKLATRKASQNCLEFFCAQLPEMIGGSADLTGSNNTLSSSNTELLPESPEGTHIYYGVREFGMTGITNGMILHGGIKPYSGTFLVFMDYARNAVRLSALMKIPNIFVYTHDSIGLGEDGPTHQPIEHLVTLRATPNLNNWRPADLTETAVAWHNAVSSKTAPTSLILTRQGLPSIVDNKDTAELIKHGGYALKFDNNSEVNLVASGSEVHLIMDAANDLEAENILCNIASIPCLDIFKAQSDEYKNQVIDPTKPTLFVEALHPDSWLTIAKPEDTVIGIKTFGESAPGDELMKEFGFTVENIISSVKKLI